MLATDLRDTQRDLAIAHARIRELEAEVLLLQQEAWTLGSHLADALSVKRSALAAIGELHRTLRQVTASPQAVAQ